MRPRSPRRRVRLAGLVAGGAVVVLTGTACGGHTPSSSPAASAAPTPSSDAAPISAQQSRLITYPSDKPFQGTVDALKMAVSSNGMMILGELDQAAALSPTGLNLHGAHTFFVGNPSAGKMFFQQTAAIGAVIPLRIFVWAGDDDKAHVSFFDPAPQFA